MGAVTHGPPGLPSDPENDEGDHEPDERVGDLEAERHEQSSGDDSEADQSVGPGVVAVGDERRTVEAAAGAEADDRGQFVAEEADGAGDPEREQVLEVLRVQQAVDGLDGGDERAEEDRANDEVAGDALGARGAQGEGDGEGDRGECVAGVVDEVGE